MSLSQWSGAGALGVCLAIPVVLAVGCEQPGPSTAPPVETVEAAGTPGPTASPTAPSAKPAATPTGAPDKAEKAPQPSGYQRQLETYSAQVRHWQQRADSGDAFASERLAGALMTRAGLTGDLDDYSAAQDALSKAFDAGRRSADFYLARARLNLSLHRVDRVAADLDAAGSGAVVPARTRLAIEARRAALALQLGQYAAARELADRLAEDDPSHTNHFRLATLAIAEGRAADADARLEAILKKLPKQGHVTSFYHLQRGLLDLHAGDYEAADVHYAAAEAALDGWWLIEEHHAEILALTGRTEEALPIYESVVERTQDPELMNALADTLEELGRPKEAAPHRAAAAKRFDEMLKRFPESASGHALEHYLEHGDVNRALELAKANHALRPNGEAAVALATALLKAGDAAKAVSMLEALLADTPFRSADLHATATEAYEATGDADKSAKHRAAALALNPKAFD